MRKSNNKSVLITGGLGYIGNQAIEVLLSEGFDVIVNDNSKENAQKFLPIWIDRIKYIHGDVCELDCPDVDFVVHLAAEVGYVVCDNKPELAMQTNIGGVKNVASFNKPTLFFSTGSVYGKQTDICKEENVCRPQTLYSKTKFEGESIIKNIDSYCIVRPATAYGLGFNTRNDLLVHNLSETAVNQGALDIYQPYAQRTMYHVKDIAKFVGHCLNHWEDFRGDVFNLGNKSGNISKMGIVQEIQKYCDFELVVRDDMEDPDERDYEVDYSKINRLWDSGDNNVSQYIGNIVEYYRSIK